jgi:hypothetical protein
MLLNDAADCGFADCGPVTPFVGVVIGTPDGVVAGIVFWFVTGFDGGLTIGVEAEFKFGFTIGLEVGFGLGLEFGFGAGTSESVIVESFALGLTIGLELGFGLGFEFGLGAGALPGCELCVAVPFDPVAPALPPFDCARQTALAELNRSADAIIRPTVFFMSPPLRLGRYRCPDTKATPLRKRA